MKKLLINFFYVFLAQGVVLLLSIVLNLIVPKFIGKTEFGYWQFFLLMTSYVGFFTIGFSDGFYLKEGGKEYENLDSKRLSGEFSAFAILQLIFSFLIFIFSFYIEEYSSLVKIFAFYLFFQNLFNFFGFVFQSASKFKNYSFSVLIDKVSFLLLLLLLIFFHTKTYLPFVIIYCLSKLISFLYCLYNGPSFFLLVKLNPTRIRKGFKNMFATMSIGINIMLSNILGSLIIGGGRFIIEHKWGIDTFSEVSLSFSLTFLFLLFVTQVGMVLFPMLKQLENKNIQGYYDKIKEKLDVLLPVILIMYYPIEKLLIIWLPQYAISVRYLIILIPLCLYEGKFHMLSLVFFKALRFEKKLLILNTVIFSLSLLLCLGNAYIVENLTGVLISLVFVIMIRSLASEYILSELGIRRNDLYELALIILFIVCNWYMPSIQGKLLFGLAFAIYYSLHVKTLRNIMQELKYRINLLK